MKRSGLRYYRLILALVSPLVLAYTAYRAFKDGGFRYVAQRLAFNLPEVRGALWVHCASVGEVNTALPLIRQLVRAQTAPLLVTTSTPTGAMVLQTTLGEQVTHAYLPLDYALLTRRFLNTLRPRAFLIAETELWPVTITSTAARGIPVVLFNARLTERTLAAPGWLRDAYAQAVAVMTRILAKSPVDATRFTALGARDAQLETIGSLKLAGASAEVAASADLPQPCWLAASTHDDEELRIARAWLRTPRKELLVLAPRHPERRQQILSQCEKAGIKAALRSEHPHPPADCRVYIADTLGELRSLMQDATCVFVGGSLIARGGHNLIEPAQLGKPVLSGPSLTNFAEEKRLLEKVGGLIVVPDEQTLIREVCRLLDNPVQVRALGQRNRDACNQVAGIEQRYLARILSLLNSEPA